MKKLVDVVMLPTQNESNILQGRTGGLYYHHRGSTSGVPQYLYFITDEQIVTGDWYLHKLGGSIHKRKEGHWNNTDPENFKKIVATTDPMALCPLCNYPTSPGDGICSEHIDGAPIGRIPKDFLETYVQKKGNITKVELEYIKNLPPLKDIFTSDPVDELKLDGDGCVFWSLQKGNMTSSAYTVEHILEYMVDHLYNETNPVLYAYIASLK